MESNGHYKKRTYVIYRKGKVLYVRMLFKVCIGFGGYKGDRYMITRTLWYRKWLAARKRRKIEAKKGLIYVPELRMEFCERHWWSHYRLLSYIGIFLGQTCEKV